jgi:ribosomal protein S30
MKKKVFVLFGLFLIGVIVYYFQSVDPIEEQPIGDHREKQIEEKMSNRKPAKKLTKASKIKKQDRRVASDQKKKILPTMLEKQLYKKYQKDYQLDGFININDSTYFKSKFSIIEVTNDQFNPDLGNRVNVSNQVTHYTIFKANEGEEELYAPVLFNPLTEQPEMITGLIYLDYSQVGYEDLVQRLNEFGYSVDYHHKVLSKVQIKVLKNKVLAITQELKERFETEVNVEIDLSSGTYVTR